MNNGAMKDKTRSWQPRGKVLLVLLVKIVVLAAVLFFWYRYVRRNWNDLASGSWNIGWQSAVIASGLILLGYVLRACLWGPMLRELTGESIPVVRAFRVSAISWMGRYVPGKLWSVASKAYLSAKDKQQIPMIGLAVVVEILWFQLGGILIAGTMLLTSKSALIKGSYQYMLAGLLVLGIIACHPGLFFRGANYVLVLLRKPKLERRPRYRVMLLVMTGNMATFLLWAGGFFVLAGGLSDVDFSLFPVIAGVFSAAWVIGFFMLLVPAGLGVRESILVFGLSGIFSSDAVVISLVLTSRILMTLIELLCFLLALLLSIFVPAAAGTKDGADTSPRVAGK
jgi:uncharacterized membrane protein YbhN (UPF0104 family)